MRRWGWLNHPQRAFSLTLWCHFLPARMPLVTPGIPCISETLLLVKYSSQVAFRYSESQKDLHNLVVTVSLSVSMSFAQTSYPLESSVRFPRRQTLERMPRKVSLHELHITINKILVTSHSREDRGVKGGLDDSSINSQDGEDDTGQEDQCQLVYILDPHKHHQSHEAQNNGPVHPHVVEESCLCLRPLQALDLKNGRLRNDVYLREWKGGGRGSGSRRMVWLSVVWVSDNDNKKKRILGLSIWMLIWNLKVCMCTKGNQLSW